MTGSREQVAFAPIPSCWAALADELRILHPQLFGLFREGWHLSARVSDPAVPFLMALAARELTVGVGRLLLTDRKDDLPEALFQDIDPEVENHRRSLARLLRLPPRDPRITEWLRLHRRFNEWSHWSERAPDAAEVQEAWNRLSALLDGILGPSFDHLDQLDSFLARHGPSEGDLETLRSLTGREVQRRYFFGQLEHPGWFSGLRRAGFFSHPAPRSIKKAGRAWSPRAWPEGEYLIRMAAEFPGEVAHLLVNIGDAHRNPQVWQVVIDCALQLPIDDASRLVPSLCGALRREDVVIFNESVPALITRFARSGSMGPALQLLSYLLRVPDGNELGLDSLDHHSSFDAGRFLLPNVESYWFREFLDEGFDALLDASSGDVRRLLAGKVALIEKVLDSPGARENGFGWGVAQLMVSREDPDDILHLLIRATRVATARALIETPGEQRDEFMSRLLV